MAHLRFKEGIYSNDGFSSKYNYLKEVLGKSDVDFNPSFLLTGKTQSITVNSWDNLNYIPILEITKWE